MGIHFGVGGSGGFCGEYASTKSFKDKLRIFLCDVRLLPLARTKKLLYNHRRCGGNGKRITATKPLAWRKTEGGKR